MKIGCRKVSLLIKLWKFRYLKAIYMILCSYRNNKYITTRHEENKYLP